MRSAWKVLSLPATGVSIPPLIIKYEIGTSDYTVWVTDLTLIWMESLDRRRVIRRSFDVDTSIDPSENPDQLRLFLKRLGDALGQQPTTTLDLVKTNRDQSLILRTFTPLPGSLKPLQWFIELLPASQSTLTTELIVPMLSQQMIANAEKASLLLQLKEKDQVISKLTDKMQSEGVDFSRLFPGVASKSSKPMSRQGLEKIVKGFGVFDEVQWRRHLINHRASSKKFIELVADAFDADLGDQPETAQTPEYNNWWETLIHKDLQPDVPVRELRYTGAEERSTQDEFQRQSTPTKRRTLSPSQKREEERTESEDVKDTARNQPHDNSDLTTDESDEDLESSWPKSMPLREKSLDHHVAARSTGKTSPISPQTASDKKAGHEGQQNPMPVPGARLSKDHISSSDGDGTQAGSRAAKSGTRVQAPALKPRVKLGKIGGKGKRISSESHSYDGRIAPEDAGKSPPNVNSSLSDEVGAVSKIATESERASRTTVRPQAPSPPRETSRERANRNREKLKRELESKSQAGAKKKRKF